MVLTDFFLTGPCQKFKKPSKNPIHTRSTRDANFDKYIKHSREVLALRGVTGRKSGRRELYPGVFA